jgi:hypothetical protein
MAGRWLSAKGRADPPDKALADQALADQEGRVGH